MIMQRKLLFSIIMLMSAVFMMLCDNPAKADPRDYLTGSMKNFLLYNEPRPVPDVQFYDARHNAVHLKAFRGKLTLVTLWATWCPYCGREMPTLNELQKKLGPRGLMILPISVDKDGAPAVYEFYKKKNIDVLPVYVDPQSQVGMALNTRGIPYSLLLDANGFEIGRNHGETDWMSPEAVAFLESFLK